MRAARLAALAVSALIASAVPALGSDYSNAVSGVASALDRAARADARVPDLHVPPAPLGGPPRYSPSVDDWLQASLNAARRIKAAKPRAQALRAIADSLRFLSSETNGAQAATGPQLDVSRTTAAILAQPAYRQPPTKPATPPQQTIWDKIINWILNEIRQLFDGLARATQGVPLLGDVFAIVLIAVAVLGLAYVGYRIGDGLLARRRAAATDDGEAMPVGASPEQLHEAALDAAAAGRYARAVTLLFQATLLVLDRTDRVTFDPSRTAGEYRRLVRDKARALAPDFDSLARVFTAAAYADDPVGERDWQQAANAFAVFAQPLAAR